MEEPAQEDDGVTIPIQSGNDVPNVNPVQDKTEPVKLTEDARWTLPPSPKPKISATGKKKPAAEAEGETI